MGKARYASDTIVYDAKRRTAQAVDSSSYWYVRLNVVASVDFELTNDAIFAASTYFATSYAVSAE